MNDLCKAIVIQHCKNLHKEIKRLEKIYNSLNSGYLENQSINTKSKRKYMEIKAEYDMFIQRLPEEERYPIQLLIEVEDDE